MAKTFRFENRSRSKFRLQAVTKDGERDADNDLVIGDAADTDEAIEALGIERNPKCPSPIVVTTDAQLAKLSPASRRELEVLCGPVRPRTGPYATGPWPVLIRTEIASTRDPVPA